MRTTVTLDPDSEQIVRRRMRDHGVSFKEAVNDLIRGGVAPPEAAPFRTETVSMGQPTIDLDRALQVAADLEDEELVRKLQMRS